MAPGDVKLKARDRWQLPLREASALCLAEDREGEAARLLAVDDEAYELAWAEIVDDDLRPGPARSVRAAVPDAEARSSEFEGVAADGAGHVFVIQEGADRVLVFDQSLSILERTLGLSVPADEPDFGREWHRDPNRRGEGLVLLGNGHLLIGKQREEARLIEFGPPSSEAQGYAPGDALASGRPFPFDSEGDMTFAPLASWLVKPASGVESVNDLACDAAGRLHLVSSKSRLLARAERELRPDDDTVALTAWALPDAIFDSDDDKAEGLVLAPRLGWLVALDLSRAAPNVFSITGVPD
jgi:hypothetical protein